MKTRRTAVRRRDVFDKVFKVLWCFADAAGDAEDKAWGVRELAEALQMSVASVHRLLMALARLGLLQRNADSGQYRIGAELVRFALKLSSRFSVRNIGLPIMRALVAKCNETAFLGYYDPSRMQVMFVAAVNSSHPLRYFVPLDEWFPVYAGASGLSVMAFLPKEQRRAIIERTGLEPLTERTITKPAALERELARIRARGYATSVGHRTVGAVAIAAPIWGPNARPIGDLALSIPEPRFRPSVGEKLGRLVVEHADKISHALGGRKGPLEDE